MPFSSERVSITLQLLASSSFWSFNTIFKFIPDSVRPSLFWAPSSGIPCPASSVIVCPVTGVDEVDIVFSDLLKERLAKKIEKTRNKKS